ncbi:hypothetical protein Tco_0091927 [Tanacetum coccineum]
MKFALVRNCALYYAFCAMFYISANQQVPNINWDPSFKPSNSMFSNARWYSIIIRYLDSSVQNSHLRKKWIGYCTQKVQDRASKLIVWTKSSSPRSSSIDVLRTISSDLLLCLTMFDITAVQAGLHCPFLKEKKDVRFSAAFNLSRREDLLVLDHSHQQDGKVRYELKGGKCVIKGIVPTEMELVMEFTQQGAIMKSRRYSTDHLKMEMEMEIPSSSNVKLMTECTDTTYTCYEVMKDLIKVSKLPQTLISYSSSQVHKMGNNC